MYEKIKELCTKAGITVKQLERELGIATGSINKWRWTSPSIEKVLLVANYFNISLDYLCESNSFKKRKESKELKPTDEFDGSIVTLQRMRKDMTERDKAKFDRVMPILFNAVFSDDNKEGDDHCEKNKTCLH